MIDFKPSFNMKKKIMQVLLRDYNQVINKKTKKKY